MSQEALGIKVETLPNGQVRVIAPTEEARANLDRFLADAAAQRAVVPIDGDAALFNGRVLDGIAQANGSVGTITIDGDPTTANGKTTAAVRFADDSITIDGRPDPATGKINGVVTYADRSTGTITLNPRDLVSATIERLKQPTSSTHIIRVIQTGQGQVYQGKGGYMREGMAAGGILKPMAGGAVLGFAAGAAATPATRPMSGGFAQKVPPNTWRLIGDNMRVTESYIPWDNSRRSDGILRDTAGAFGYDLVPRGTKLQQGPGGAVAPMAEGGMLSAARAILGLFGAPR